MTTHTTTASLTSMTIMTWVIIGPRWAKPSWKRYMGKGSFAAKAFAICMKSHCEIIGKAIQLCPLWPKSSPRSKGWSPWKSKSFQVPLAKVEPTVESRFSPFFHFHPRIMSVFHRYSLLSMDDEQFSPFFHFHPRIMNVFHRFLAFIHGWRAIFTVFSLSSMDDERFFGKNWWFTPVSEQFFAFLAFRWPTTDCFQCFLRFVGRRRAFFCKFCVSLTSDERFSAFSACRCKRNTVFVNFRRKTTSDSLFSAFFARRLQAKRCFWQFSKKNHKRQPVFCVFYPSLASETLFFAFSAFRSRARGTPIVLGKSGEVNVYIVCWRPKNLLNSASGRERSCFFGQGGQSWMAFSSLLFS